jgi:hypothetical protein
MKRLITNPLAVIAPIFAMTVTAAAQTPTVAQTPSAIETPTIVQRGDGFAVNFRVRGGRAYRTSVTCKTTSDGWSHVCYYSSHTCGDLFGDMLYCCDNNTGNVATASCDAKVD